MGSCRPYAEVFVQNIAFETAGTPLRLEFLLKGIWQHSRYKHIASRALHKGEIVLYLCYYGAFIVSNEGTAIEGDI